MKIIDINGQERDAAKIYPDPAYPGFMRIQFRRHHEWWTIKEFLQHNPNLTKYTKSAPNVPDDTVGVVTSSTINTLKDTRQNWQPNSYTGFFVWISRGQGEGQKRTVVKNSKNTLTIDQEWDTKPNTTSQYVISFNIREVKAFGNALPLEDLKALEKKAIQIDKMHGKLSSDRLKKTIKYMSEEELLSA